MLGAESLRSQVTDLSKAAGSHILGHMPSMAQKNKAIVDERYNEGGKIGREPQFESLDPSKPVSKAIPELQVLWASNFVFWLKVSFSGDFKIVTESHN